MRAIQDSNLKMDSANYAHKIVRLVALMILDVIFVRMGIKCKLMENVWNVLSQIAKYASIQCVSNAILALLFIKAIACLAQLGANVLFPIHVMHAFQIIPTQEV